MQAETKPKVVVIGAGWGGWAAAKALCENGCAVTLLDGVPDPSGSKPMLTPTGKPFEVGQRGFWNDYPNIEALLAEKNVLPPVLTPLPPLAPSWSLAVVTTSRVDALEFSWIMCLTVATRLTLNLLCRSQSMKSSQISQVFPNLPTIADLPARPLPYICAR